MAAPNSPTGVTVKPGGSPMSAIVSWTDGGGGTPDSYEVYISNATGVSSVAYLGKKPVDVSRLFVEIEGIPYDNVYATVTATNSEGSSADATEGSGFINP